MNLLYKIYPYVFGRVIFRKINRILFELSIRGLGILNYDNKYLNGEDKWLKKYLKDKSKPIVFDIGANNGNYSKSIYNANKSSRVFAFEPHPKSFKKLISNIDRANFLPVQLGVGDKIGKLNLFDYSKNDGSEHASLYEGVITDIHKSQAKSIEVNIITLDEFFKKHTIERVDLLKIDTEGYELNVLKGAKQYLKNGKIEAIQFEFNEMNIISKTSFKDFLEILVNYDLYRLMPGGRLLKIYYTPVHCEIYAYQNIIAFLK